MAILREWVLQCNHAQRCIMKDPGEAQNYEMMKRAGLMFTREPYNGKTGCWCTKRTWNATGNAFFPTHIWRVTQRPRTLTNLIKACRVSDMLREFLEKGEQYRLYNIRTKEVIPLEALGI